MREKSKTLHGQNAGFKDQERVDGRDQQEQYTNSADFIQDTNKYEREIHHYRSVTPEPRVAVYRIAASVPFVNHAALRSRGWI